MRPFSVRTGLLTLAVYTLALGLLAAARGSVGSPGFWQRVLLVALSGFLVGFFLDPLARSVRGSAWRRYGILLLLIFSLAIVSNAIETALYLPAIAVAGTIAGGFVQSIVLAAVLVRVTQPARDDTVSGMVRLGFGEKVVFVALLAVAWLPVYFAFVALDTPVVHRLQRGGSDVFAHPPVVPMLSFELVRGVIHAAVLLGITLLARGRPRTLWLWGALAISILNGWLLLLPVSTLPLGIRIANGCEITLSSITFAGLAAALVVGLTRRRPPQEGVSRRTL